MCRIMLPLLLFVNLALGAPQDNSAITYVKPLIVDDAPPLPTTRESRIEKLPLTIGLNTDLEKNKALNPEKVDKPSESESSDQTSRNVANDYTTLSYETSESTEVTVRSSSSDEVVDQTEAYETKVKPPTPRFLPKLSHYSKTDGYRDSALTNLIERGSKRRFRSRCRCEKIWNCPKLQISVPRCPNEYFMCCF